jgi:hypothetical protein
LTGRRYKSKSRSKAAGRGARSTWAVLMAGNSRFLSPPSLALRLRSE